MKGDGGGVIGKRHELDYASIKAALGGILCRVTSQQVSF